LAAVDILSCNERAILKAGIKLLSDSILLVENDLFLDITSKEEAAALKVVQAHNGNVPYLAEEAAAFQAKAALLQRLGITEDEAKLLLS
jgi:hypothetical protein